MNKFLLASGCAAILITSGCASLKLWDLENQYGAPEPRDRVVDVLPTATPDYWTEVKPVLEKRCVVCHACYDAPCQLKLGSLEGIQRGASRAPVYNSTRLRAAPTTRLFEDAADFSTWRERGFFPVLNEYVNSPQANRDLGVMYRILRLKEENPLPADEILEPSFDLSLNRKQSCARADGFSDFSRSHPLWGMPYALPGLGADEQAVLLKWLEDGAPYTKRIEPGETVFARVQRWEDFLNTDSLKGMLMARYLYEHLFLAHLHFPDVDERWFFRLIRSSTPPGQPAKMISTRRPYDDPGVSRVYYRLVPHNGAIVAKTHMPYALDSSRMKKWKSWFLDVDYSVGALPVYGGGDASNPFRTFQDLPVDSRYRFLLDEARFTIMSFIKGPVCRGQVALNVINDHFWVFFVDPDHRKIEYMEEYAVGQAENMELPASTEEIFRPIHHWRRYADQQKAFLARADENLSANADALAGIGLDIVWNGEGENNNAALTIFRHFDSATVEKGLLGDPPKTAWLIDYPLLERIHYLLVAGYDVYGNLGHQLLSRVYMDFLRMEGETGFLALLPQEARERERRYWYREADEEILDFMTLPRFESRSGSIVKYSTNDEKKELFAMLREHLAQVLPDKYSISKFKDSHIQHNLRRLGSAQGGNLFLMPEVSFVEIVGSRQSEFSTVIRNNAHLNITSLFGEQKLRKPEEDTLSVIPGLLGAYPNIFFVVDLNQLEEFVNRVIEMKDESDYVGLVNDFGIRRTNPDFWRHSDRFQEAFSRGAGIQGGILDFARLENR